MNGQTERVGISKLAIGIALCLALAGVVLIVQRNGLLAWLGLLLGAGLCLKALRRPARTDPYLTEPLPHCGRSPGRAFFTT